MAALTDAITAFLLREALYRPPKNRQRPPGARIRAFVPGAAHVAVEFLNRLTLCEQFNCIGDGGNGERLRPRSSDGPQRDWTAFFSPRLLMAPIRTMALQESALYAQTEGSLQRPVHNVERRLAAPAELGNRARWALVDSNPRPPRCRLGATLLLSSMVRFEFDSSASVPFALLSSALQSPTEPLCRTAPAGWRCGLSAIG